MSYEAKLTPEAAAFHERMFPGYVSDFLRTDPEFIERFDNFAFDEVVAGTPELSDRTRFMCWLATCLGCQGIDEFRSLIPAAMRFGLTPVEIKEVVYQAVDYLGIGRVFPFLKATNEVLEAQGVELPLEPQATTEPTYESRKAGGEQAQVSAFGEQMRGFHDSGANGREQINQWLVRNCFGDFYTRGGLDIADRELITFCFLAAQGGCESQLQGHTRGNLHCGRTREFLIAVVSNNLPFIGYPRTLNALAVVDQITKE